MNRTRRRDSDQPVNLIPLLAEDLRTPITTIKGMSQLTLRRGDLPPPAAFYLTTVVEAANQIATLVDDLVLSDRASSGDFVPRRSRVDVISFLHKIVDEYSVFDGEARPLIVPSPKPILAAMDVHLTARAVVRLLQVSTRLARSDERVYVGAYNQKGGMTIWMTGRPKKVTLDSLALTEDFPSRFGRDVQSDAVDLNLAVFLAASLIAAQGGRVHRGFPRDATGFHVVLPEDPVSKDTEGES